MYSLKFIFLNKEACFLYKSVTKKDRVDNHYKIKKILHMIVIKGK